MSSFLEELKEENAKSGIFDEVDAGVSYSMGLPIIDQMLGFKQIIVKPDGETIDQYRIGLTGGSLNMFVGPSSSGKTAAAIQAANNITEPFGDDSVAILLDAENSTEDQRILDLTGIDAEEYSRRWVRLDDPLMMTVDGILTYTKAICAKKEKEKDRFIYDTPFYNIHGERITYYKPTVMIIDSLMRIVTDKDDLEDIQGLTSGGRDAIFRGKLLRNLLGYCRRFNIIVIIINHLGNEIQLQPGKGGSKQLTFIPTGKNIPGGEKNIYYNNAILVFQPINSKDQIKTIEVNGYNGVTIKISVSKSRTGPGGTTAQLEFVQETGFDVDLTLMNFARDKELISGRNPSCYFVSRPDIKFDSRVFLRELEERPELVQAMYESCGVELKKMVRVAPSAQSDICKTKKRSRKYLRELF